MGAYYFPQDGIPNIECPIETLDFGGVKVGESNMITLPIENAGLADLDISGVIVDPDAFATVDSSFTVNSMGRFEVIISFTPSD